MTREEKERCRKERMRERVREGKTVGGRGHWHSIREEVSLKVEY